METARPRRDVFSQRYAEDQGAGSFLLGNFVPISFLGIAGVDPRQRGASGSRRFQRARKRSKSTSL